MQRFIFFLSFHLVLYSTLIPHRYPWLYIYTRFFLLQQLTMLIQDSLDPNKFKYVLVVKSEERKARMHATSSKKPSVALLNYILSCVFTSEELSKSSGLGIRS